MRQNVPYYARLDLEDGKAIAMKPLGGGFVMRLMRHDLACSPVCRLNITDLEFRPWRPRFDGQGFVIRPTEDEDCEIKYLGELFAAVDGDSWHELVSLANKIRRGEYIHDREIFFETGVRLVQVR